MIWARHGRASESYGAILGGGSTPAPARQRGFALVAVLAILAVLAVLATSATLRLTALSSRMGADAAVASGAGRADTLVRRALAARSIDAGGDRIELDGRPVTLIDVGGLIDLNAAAPALLEALVAGAGGGSPEVVRYRDWRRDGRRLLRVGDFARITGLPVDADWLRRRATVRSGRTGVALDEAPAVVRDLIEPLIAVSVVPATAPSGATFQVWAGDRFVGVGSIVGEGGVAVLEIAAVPDSANPG